MRRLFVITIFHVLKKSDKNNGPSKYDSERELGEKEIGYCPWLECND